MSKNLSPVQAEVPTVVPDGELVARAQAGDARAFDELVRRHYDKTFRLSRYLCGGHAEDAEDTFQNALANAYRHLAAFRGEAQFSTWLTRIAVNECLLHRRRHRKEQGWVRLDEEPGEDQSFPFEPADVSDDPEEDYARQEFLATFQNCVAALPESFRKAVILQAIEGLPINEIATRLGLSPSAVKSRVFRARRQLQRCLSEKFCRGQQCYWPGTKTILTYEANRKEGKTCSPSS